MRSSTSCTGSPWRDLRPATGPYTIAYSCWTRGGAGCSRRLLAPCPTAARNRLHHHQSHQAAAGAKGGAGRPLAARRGSSNRGYARGDHLPSGRHRESGGADRPRHFACLISHQVARHATIATCRPGASRRQEMVKMIRASSGEIGSFLNSSLLGWAVSDVSRTPYANQGLRFGNKERSPASRLSHEAPSIVASLGKRI